MKNILKSLIITIGAIIFTACGSSDESGPVSISTANFSISGSIQSAINTSPSYNPAPSIDNVSVIIPLYITNGELDVTILNPIPIDSQGYFKIEFDSTHIFDDTKIILVMGTNATALEDKIVGLVPLTGENETMTSFPVSKLINNLDLGEIKEINGTFVSTNTLESNVQNFSLDEATLISLARLDDAEAILINRYINTDVTTGTYFISNVRFIHEQSMELIRNQFPSIDSYLYAGYRVPMISNKTSLTDSYSNICAGSKKIEVVPPTEVQVVESNVIHSPSNPYINNNLSYHPTDPTTCEDIQMGFRVFNRGENFQLELSNIQGREIPSGYWTLKEDDQVQASFDLSVGSIFDTNGNYNILIPSVKVEVDTNHKFTKALIKWYKYDETIASYMEVTDPYIISSHVKGVNFFLQDYNGLDGNLTFEGLQFRSSNTTIADIQDGEVLASAFQNDWYFKGADESVNLVLDGFSIDVYFTEDARFNLDFQAPF